MNPAADHLAFLRRIVDEQAEDEGLWFIAQTAPEAYLQQELRRLHTYIECATGKVGGADLYGPMHSAFAPDDPEDVESAPPLRLTDEDKAEIDDAYEESARCQRESWAAAQTDVVGGAHIDGSGSASNDATTATEDKS